jgi:hypothetical protein
MGSEEETPRTITLGESRFVASILTLPDGSLAANLLAKERAGPEENTHMADPPPYLDFDSDTGEDTRVGSDRGSATSTPRWVKVFGIILIVLVLLFVILHLTDRGHGGHTPPIERRVQQS